MSMCSCWLRACVVPLAVCLAFALPGASQTPVPRGRGVRPPVVRHVPGEYATIQRAIDAAHDGDVVVVSPGTYSGPLDFRGKALEIVAPDGPEVTIVRGTSNAAVVRFHNGEGPDSRLIGFTIRGGGGSFDDSAGGVSGVSLESGVAARALLSDCIVENCFTEQDFGYGPAGVSGNLLLERCRLRNNHTLNFEDAGAGTGAFTLIQCVVEQNSGCSGGGLRLLSGAHVIECVLRANQAGPCGTREGPSLTPGGGLNIAGSGVVIERSLLIENRVAEGPIDGGLGGCGAYSHGGALSGNALLERCTIVDNRTLDCGFIGGLDGNPELRDCIVYGNEDPSGFYAQQAFRYSDVQGGAAGIGSFDALPELVEHGPYDVRLAADSPCIDRGDPLSPLDPDGTRADLGARHHPQGEPALGVALREREPLRPLDPTRPGGTVLAVAAQGDTLLAGGHYQEVGAVHVLRRQDGAWLAQQDLESGETSDEFGDTLALDGNVAVAGAPAAGDTGAVHVFERSGPSALFEHSARLSEPAYRFGTALALSGNFLAVGALLDDFEHGAVFLYHRVARGRWELAARFRSPAVDVFFGVHFGSTVALQGDTLVVGSPMFGQLIYPGRAFVYQRAGRAPQSWTLVRTLVPEDPVDGDAFGQSLAIDGDTILVGARSGVHAYERRGPGLPWSRAQTILAEETSQRFSTDVRLDGDRAWITAGGTFALPGRLWELARLNAGAPWRVVADLSFPPPSGFPQGLAVSEGSLFLPAFDVPSGTRVVRHLTRGPELRTVALDQAAEAEPIALTGRDLAAVTRVLVGGEEVPIVSRTDERLVLAPERRVPGIAELVLESPEGDLALARGWHAAPTVAAHASGLGGRLAVELENGAPGVYALLWSLDLRARPLHVARPPTWHALELDFLPGRSGQLALGAFDADGRAAHAFDLPADPALVGLTLHVQAWCRRGLLFPTGHSFSNTVSLGL